MVFGTVSDETFRDTFLGIITKGSVNNTYKFALARFLLDYSNKCGSERIRYRDMARYFFRYYWIQECKSRLRQGPKNQTPEIIQIIRKEFTEKIYPHTFAKLERKEPEKIKRCVEQIAKKCFDDVIPRFQKLDGEKKIFYDYFAKAYHDSADNKKLDPGGGILLNVDAMRFLRENYVPLYKAVILQWIRFLERANFGTPNLVKKIEEDRMGPRDQARFRKHLESFVNCFYCGTKLEPGRCTHVDHVIPYDYVGDTELWNLVLACQKCNCEKLGNLPPKQYLEKLLKRNKKYDSRICQLRESLDMLEHDEHDIKWHYRNARKHGYPIIKNFPKRKRV